MKKIPTEDFLSKKGPLFHPSVFEENLDESHPHPHFDKAVFSWIAPEYLQHPKSIRWWTTAGVVVAIAVIIEAIVSNWTMLVATLVFAGVYTFVHEYNPPKHTKVNISELGIKIGHKKIPYENIECFWIIYNPPMVRRLYLRLKTQLLSDLVIELEDQDPLLIREYLERNVAEMTGVRESLTDVILRIIKL